MDYNRTYVVKPGDTMYKIAKRFNVPLEVLIAANPQISNPDLIYPGQIIMIPASTPGPLPCPPKHDHHHHHPHHPHHEHHHPQRPRPMPIQPCPQPAPNPCLRPRATRPCPQPMPYPMQNPIQSPMYDEGPYPCLPTGIPRSKCGCDYPTVGPRYPLGPNWRMYQGQPSGGWYENYPVFPGVGEYPMYPGNYTMDEEEN
ncbi:hypothetical protein BHU72_09260 [Desulfuribacillus stibiiarsenatis]|uniref:LysM domain-containing protein n=1 Tax=Desulfuribacillus stibiiarsenatis TaxID=1390249 RepID=A0A1E5L2S2_9FIRM|nr:LysM domain-containing protein [Desulfuribacillus stibiiarsenatis]OEH84397.1 hypothetical protein BHU72_09260 [Desulfuribacillus stibiiarsenatis]